MRSLAPAMAITAASWSSGRAGNSRVRHCQQRAPLGEAGVAGEQNGSLLVAGGDEITDRMRLFGGQSGIAHLVNHQYARRNRNVTAPPRWGA